MSASRPRVCRGGSAASWRTNIGVPPAGVDRRRMLPTAPHGGCSPVPADDSPAVDMPAPRRTAASLAARDDGVKRQWTVRPRRPHAMACTLLRPLSRTRPTGPVEAWPSRRPVGPRRGQARRRARKGWLSCAPSFMTVLHAERAAPPSASATAPPYTTTAARSEGVGRCYLYSVVTSCASRPVSSVVSWMKGHSGKAPVHWLKRRMRRWTWKRRSWYGFWRAWAMV